MRITKMKKLTEKQEKEIISNHFSKLAKKKHAKMTKKQRSELGRKMVMARWNKEKYENN